MIRFLILFLLIFPTFAKADIVKNCNAPELVEGAKIYNAFLCSGIRSAEKQKYSEAITAFESALSTPLHETPNFELLTRLAWTHFRAGNYEKATSVLQSAEISLSVLTGVFKCVETRDGFFLSDAFGRIDGAAAEKVVNRMCGAAYDYIYEKHSLERVLLEAELVKRFFEVKRHIKNRDTRNETK